jgi:hypothetical protein
MTTLFQGVKKQSENLFEDSRAFHSFSGAENQS